MLFITATSTSPGKEHPRQEQELRSAISKASGETPPPERTGSRGGPRTQSRSHERDTEAVHLTGPCGGHESLCSRPRRAIKKGQESSTVWKPSQAGSPQTPRRRRGTRTPRYDPSSTRKTCQAPRPGATGALPAKDGATASLQETGQKREGLRGGGACTHTSTSTQAGTHTQRGTRTYTGTHKHTRRHTCTQARRHAHTQVHTRTHKCTRVHTQARAGAPAPPHLALAVGLHQLAERRVSLDLELDHGAVLPGHLQVDVVILRLHPLLQRHADLASARLPTARRSKASVRRRRLVSPTSLEPTQFPPRSSNPTSAQKP